MKHLSDSSVAPSPAGLTSCGVLVSVPDGRLLLGQATGTKRWDIPKGIAESSEAFADAAARELKEETGLVASPADLQPLGVFRYLPKKQLALFAWSTGPIDPAALRCTSMFQARNGRMLPEIAHFALVERAAIAGLVGKNLARVLEGLAAPSD